MILTAYQFAERFKLKGKRVSFQTIKRRCEAGLMPSWCECEKIYGSWYIYINDKEEIRCKDDMKIKRIIFVKIDDYINESKL